MLSLLLKDLNSQQIKAVTHGSGPLLILAGAGSGKTRALTYRAAWLLAEKKAHPDNLLLITFTNKAANEMKQRIKKLLQTDHPNNLPLTSTFHSFCARSLRIDGKHIGLPASFTIYDQQDQKDLVKQILFELNLSLKQFAPAYVLHSIGEAKNELISSLEYPQYVRGSRQKTIAAIYLKYQQKLKESNALDFDDLLFYMVELLKKQPQVLEQYQNRFRWVLVDEYQDTNHAQYELIKLLVRRWRNLTAVGDASQSIYRWRGADFQNLTRLKQDFPDLSVVNLERNYRSPQFILDAAYAVINKNSGHPILKLWTDNKTKEKIQIYQADNERDEANFIITTLHQLDRNLNSKSKNSQLSCAVLYRTNSQSRPIEEVLIRTGIPYVLVGGVRFYERKEIKDCLAYLRLINNPKDALSFKRVEKLGKTRLRIFLSLDEKLKQKKKQPTTLKLLDLVLSKTNYWDLFDEKNEDDLSRIENIKELRSVAAEFSSLQTFLENVALVQQEHPASGGADLTKGIQHTFPEKIINKTNGHPLTLMTLHSAKGLEFDVVFIVGMEEGLFPHSRSMLDKDELEEERRLCYVGITRAKKVLYLVYSAKRLYFGLRQYNQVSRFIIDIPEDLIQLTVPGF